MARILMVRPREVAEKIYGGDFPALWGYALSFGLSGLHAVQASKHTIEHTVPRDVLIARICALVEKRRLSEPKLLPSLKPQPIDAEYQELETSDAERVTVQSAAVGNFRS